MKILLLIQFPLALDSSIKFKEKIQKKVDIILDYICNVLNRIRKKCFRNNLY